MVWNEDTIRQLRELWAEGHSTAEIGRRLGVSKNAIVGKAHRLELDARPSPIRRESGKPDAERPAPLQRPAGPTLPPLASASVAPPVVRLDPPAPRRVPVPEATVRVPVLPARPPARAEAPPMRAMSPQPIRRAAPTCCWPIGEPGTKAFRFCDDLSLPGKPYCDDHAKLAYVRIKDRKEDAA
jgi:GcrA cell cycle regulator